MSSTGVVTIFVPIMLRMASRSGIAPAQLMMPMAYAALINRREPGARELVVIDHNQAFDQAAERADFSEHHVFAAQARQLSGDFFRRDEYHERLSNALDAWPTILSEIPDAWWFVDNEQTVPVDFDTRAIETLLRGFENDNFWTWT